MRNRTRAIAAAAVIAAVAAGTTAAAASATGTKSSPTTHAKVSAGSAGAADNELASRLGVSQTRLDSALRAAKGSLAKIDGTPTEGQFYSALAHNLGIPLSRIRQVLPAEQPSGSKRTNAARVEQQGHETMAAAIAQALHLSTARVNAALRPLFAAGAADPSSPTFAAAARSLGVTTTQLNAALVHAKESLSGGN